jgi:hypothetical protein
MRENARLMTQISRGLNQNERQGARRFPLALLETIAGYAVEVTYRDLVYPNIEAVVLCFGLKRDPNEGHSENRTTDTANTDDRTPFVRHATSQKANENLKLRTERPANTTSNSGQSSQTSIRRRRNQTSPSDHRDPQALAIEPLGTPPLGSLAEAVRLWADEIRHRVPNGTPLVLAGISRETGHVSKPQAGRTDCTTAKLVGGGAACQARPDSKCGKKQAATEAKKTGPEMRGTGDSSEAKASQHSAAVQAAVATTGAKAYFEVSLSPVAGMLSSQSFQAPLPGSIIRNINAYSCGRRDRGGTGDPSFAGIERLFKAAIELALDARETKRGVHS